jgi:hypothetical protein
MEGASLLSTSALTACIIEMRKRLEPAKGIETIGIFLRLFRKTVSTWGGTQKGVVHAQKLH